MPEPETKNQNQYSLDPDSYKRTGINRHRILKKVNGDQHLEYIAEIKSEILEFYEKIGEIDV